MTDTNAIATVSQPKSRAWVIGDQLQAKRKDIAAALPPDISPDAVIRAFMTSAQINPDLQACSFTSLWLAIMRACRDGLLPDGREGAIVPYKTSAQWIPMVQGLLKRFRQSGECRWITADVVRQGEEFERYISQDGERFKHVPGDDDKAPVVKVYAAALTRSGGFHCAVLSMNEINKIRNMSRATREDSPWRQWPEEMMKKSALRRLSKMLPSGHGIIADDDLPGAVDAPRLAPEPAAERERPRSAAAALDQFANTPRSPQSVELDGGDAQQLAPMPTVDESDVAAVVPDPIEVAYAAGKRAKLTGINRRAMPGEYRSPDHQREAMAWVAGFDEKPCPTWSDGDDQTD